MANQCAHWLASLDGAPTCALMIAQNRVLGVPEFCGGWLKEMGIKYESRRFFSLSKVTETAYFDLFSELEQIFDFFRAFFATFGANYKSNTCNFACFMHFSETEWSVRKLFQRP